MRSMLWGFGFKFGFAFLLAHLLIISGVSGQTPAPAVSSRSSKQKTPVTFKVQRHGKTYYGRPLVTDGKLLALVRWDGRLKTFAINDSDLKITKHSDGFRPYSVDELQQRLKKYFGNQYAISTTEHYVVIHPRNGTTSWAQPLERHYMMLTDYFNAHGFETTEPEYPLVAIVLRSRQEFDLRLDREATYNKNTIGFYSKKSNRITTFAPSGERLTPDGVRRIDNWLQKSRTVVHEVAHQIAFNCGMHNRFSTVPQWTSEGLATLCETRGVYDFKQFPEFSDRINQQRLKSFRLLREAGKTEGKLLELIQNDRLFQTDSDVAYAVAWAISFYLNEKRQAQYMDYLRKDALRADFRRHTKLDRVSFFIRHFGKGIEVLENRMNLFIDAMP